MSTKHCARCNNRYDAEAFIYEDGKVRMPATCRWCEARRKAAEEQVEARRQAIAELAKDIGKYGPDEIVQTR